MKKIVLAALAFVAVALSAPGMAGAADVGTTDDISASVRGLFGHMGGVKPAPDGLVTRAMFVTALTRIDGEAIAAYLASGAGLPFTDVSDTAWYADAAGWAAQHNILTCSCASSAFGPQVPVTREDMAVAICRYLDSKGYGLGLRPGLETYADEDQISAYRDVKSLEATGIMTADKDGRFNPARDVTQGEVVEAFGRLIEALD